MPRPDTFILASIAVLLAGCAGAPTPSVSGPQDGPAATGIAPREAEAVLRDRTGAVIGTAQLTREGTGPLHVAVQVEGVSPGLHGIHLHAVGACDASTPTPFASAGGHHNPTGREHGFENPRGPHRGDLPNLVVNEQGVGHLHAAREDVTLAELFDADGTAVVLHQNRDDQRTDKGPQGPGSSGSRIACGVLTAD